MNSEDWAELNALRKAISMNPAAVDSANQERFTALFVESLRWVDSVPPYGTVFPTSLTYPYDLYYSCPSNPSWT